MQNIFVKNTSFGLMRSITVAVIVMATMASCGRKEPMEGSWQLVEYCYGTDCVMLADHGLTQTWELTGDVEPAANADNNATVFRRGRISQEGVMDDTVMWSLNAKGDTLHIYNKKGISLDAFYVTEQEEDTLVLSSLINNILVRQRFLRI